jgi:hypothetical protein
MKGPEEADAVPKLHRQGCDSRRIAVTPGMSRNTVHRHGHAVLPGWKIDWQIAAIGTDGNTVIVRQELTTGD